MMKPITILRKTALLSFLLVCIFALVTSASAQTASISGIYNANTNQSNPLTLNSYISIYGSNLSTGSGSLVQLEIPYQQCTSSGCVGLANDYYYNSSNGGASWYESAIQINMYLPSGPFQSTGTYYGGIRVLKSGDTNYSNQIGFNVSY